MFLSSVYVLFCFLLRCEGPEGVSFNVHLTKTDDLFPIFDLIPSFFLLSLSLFLSSLLLFYSFLFIVG